MKNKLQYIALSLGLSGLPASAGVVAHLPMELSEGKLTENVTGAIFEIKGNFAPESVAGAVGNAVYFDGYSTQADGQINLSGLAGKPLTVSLWMAVPCYPIVELDVRTKEKATIISCLDDQAKKGFGFYLGMDGLVEFRIYVGGWLISVESTRPVATYQWQNLVAELDPESRQIHLYCNGEEIGTGRCNGTPDDFTGTLRLGYGPGDRKMGSFNLMAFNGLLDEIEVSTELIGQEALRSRVAENKADLTIPASRFAEDLLRPRFHGMPGAGWTNESHGMTWSDGRYHVFFQKNANGPYMARLHWGHISSENLFDWREEKIAIAPGEEYDFKGCWSGCVFSDDILTQGKPSIIYTAVDYAKASIAQAHPIDASLIDWKKNTTPLIASRPLGLSDDFRDPYFFRNGDNAYIIVGTSKDNKGAATLHRYQGGRWTNDGSIFFSAESAQAAGSFWEMPTVTEMENGKWLFTATPLETSTGVRTLYWTGSINDNGTFAADASWGGIKQVELISKDGYGLLSPTIFKHDGKTLVLGIVPDKLPGYKNHELGWAHCYSLPREWSVGADGMLWQKPYEGLKAMRQTGGFSKENVSITGVETLNPVEGRMVELEAIFEAGSSAFGFNVLKNSNGEAMIRLNPATSKLIVDLRNLDRISNDAGAYDGLYEARLPETIRQGSDVKLHVFLDGSILDIFVNDKYATSIRVFPTSTDNVEAEAVADGNVNIRSLKGWNLDPRNASGISEITAGMKSDNKKIHTLSGITVGDTTPENIDSLPAGIYMIGGSKIMKR